MQRTKPYLRSLWFPIPIQSHRAFSILPSCSGSSIYSHSYHYHLDPYTYIIFYLGLLLSVQPNTHQSYLLPPVNCFYLVHPVFRNLCFSLLLNGTLVPTQSPQFCHPHFSLFLKTNPLLQTRLVYHPTPKHS